MRLNYRALRRLANALGLVAVAIAIGWFIWHYDVWKYTLSLLMLPFVFLWGACDELDKARCELRSEPYPDSELSFQYVSGSVEWEVDADAIAVRDSGNRRDTLRMPFSSLQAVYIRTTSLGPWLEDFFYVLDDGETKLEVPLSAACDHHLTDHLFALPGFDHGAVVAASASTDDRVFVAWESRPQWHP